MGIARTAEWLSTRSVDETDAQLRAAMEQLSLDPTGEVGSIHAKSRRSLIKNRWAAELSAEITQMAVGSNVRWHVDMLGTKHFEILDEIADRLPDGTLDDRGIDTASRRLGPHHIFGRKEIGHLHNLLASDEKVVALGQGQYQHKQGILVLTTERLFFLEKSFMNQESIDEFPPSSISSLSVRKSVTGETLIVHSSGNNVEIDRMGHGHADNIVRSLSDLRKSQAPRTDPTPRLDAENPLAQIEKLALLHEKGIVSDEEFEAKKAELLGRL